MCGLVAFFSRNSITAHQSSAPMQRMHHRGPDAEGLWQEPGVMLGHRRLAILDLDARAAQPMHSRCGRYVIVFNGEVYNFRALRRDLEAEGECFATTSDTEVLLALFAREGEAMLPKLLGMFAFVIWDRQQRRAFAARDPYGIKPLYLAKIAGGMVLASQVKALLATGLVSREPDAIGQAGFWMLGSVPEPRTWFRDIQAVRAGHCLWIEEGGKPQAQRCWHDIGSAWRNSTDTHMAAITDAQESVREALRESVARHLVSDVPVGVFLSGGIDSSAVAGLMTEAGARGLVGVTVAYHEFANTHEDEAPPAALVAAHYGIQHHVRRVTREEFLSDLPRILDAMDQPSVDGVNTWYASKAVAELGLKVVVSGVGGDELFQGYSHFRSLPRLLRVRDWLRWLPGSASGLRLFGRVQARRSDNARWCHFEDWTRTIEGAWWLRRSTCAPEQLPGLMGAELAQQALREFDVVEQVRAMTGPLPRDPLLAIGQIESMTYLRNQLLRDSDWASMDHSVELRTPLVDAHLLQTLQPLLGVFFRYAGKALPAGAPQLRLPEIVFSRPKTGFSIPVQRWLRQVAPGDSDASCSGWTREAARAHEHGVTL